jgi:hypothetical protein
MYSLVRTLPYTIVYDLPALLMGKVGLYLQVVTHTPVWGMRVHVWIFFVKGVIHVYSRPLGVLFQGYMDSGTPKYNGRRGTVYGWFRRAVRSFETSQAWIADAMMQT